MTTLAGIELLATIWEDEFADTPVDQNVRYTLGGKPIIGTAMRTSGRPITLRCQWVSLADLHQLELLRDQPNSCDGSISVLWSGIRDIISPY